MPFSFLWILFSCSSPKPLFLQFTFRGRHIPATFRKHPPPFLLSASFKTWFKIIVLQRDFSNVHLFSHPEPTSYLSFIWHINVIFYSLQAVIVLKLGPRFVWIHLLSLWLKSASLWGRFSFDGINWYHLGEASLEKRTQNYKKKN